MKAQQQLSKRIIPVHSIKYSEKSKIEIRNSILQIGSDSESFWRKFLNEKVDQKKLFIVNQPGDGDCLFHSLAKYIPNMNARKLRTEIVHFERQHKQFQVTQMILADEASEVPELQSYLQENNIEFQKLSKPKKFELYLTLMNKTGVYGQNLELKAFTDIYHLNIVILQSDNFINIIVPDDGVSKDSIFLFYNGIHYDVLYVEPDHKSLKKCPSKKIFNPKTGNCISTTSSIGKKLLKEKCNIPPIKNPYTGRCVDKHGKLGKKLVKENKIEYCVEKRNSNPKTGRCTSEKKKSKK